MNVLVRPEEFLLENWVNCCSRSQGCNEPFDDVIDRYVLIQGSQEMEMVCVKMIARTEDVWCKLLTRGLTNEAGLREGVARTEVIWRVVE